MERKWFNIHWSTITDLQWDEYIVSHIVTIIIIFFVVAKDQRNNIYTNEGFSICSLNPDISFGATIIDKIALFIFYSRVKHPDCFESNLMEIISQRCRIWKPLLQTRIVICLNIILGGKTYHGNVKPCKKENWNS